MLATAELRKRRQNHAKETSIPGKRLAEFLASAEAHEVVFTQRLQDAEAQDVFAQMGSVHNVESGEKLLDEQTACMISQPEQAQDAQEEDMYAGLEIYEEYQ